MALEQPSRAPNALNGDINGVDFRTTSTDGGDDGSKTPRLPRWTRQEILVLITGKKVVENRGRDPSAGITFGSGQAEPKWASVSSYCKRNGVNRGPVQCRKRWSNLAGDYKKIKEWESQIRDESDSFWLMRNDVRRVRKLPGFFDKDVFDVLDSRSDVSPYPGLSLGMAIIYQAPNSKDVKEEDEAEAVTGSRSGKPSHQDVLFTDSEHGEAGRSPEKEAGTKEDTAPAANPAIPAPVRISVTGNEKQPTSNPEKIFSYKGRKRKRSAWEGDDLQDQLMDVMEKNGKLLNAQLETQNVNCQLDREQRKDEGNSLAAVLNKLADALGRIADKL